MNEKHRELMVKCFMASGRTQSQAEELYDRTYEAKKPVRTEQADKAKPVQRTERPAAAVVRMAAVPAKVAASPEAPVHNRTKGTLLENITEQLGEPCCYDGRYCVWVTKDNGRTRDSLDVRDIAGRMHTTADAVVDCLPSFAPVRRGRAAESPEDDNE